MAQRMYHKRGRGGRGRGRGRGRVPNKVPDHVLNPEKWKKYSLEEDGSSVPAHDGLSGDQLNKKIALDFMGELRKRSANDSQNENEEETMDTCEKISFKAPVKPCTANDEKSVDTECVSSSHSTKARVMRTYHIGEKRVATQSKRVGHETDSPGVNKLVTKAVELDYLDKGNDVENSGVQVDSDDIKKVEDIETVSESAPSNTFVSRKKKDRKGLRKRIDNDEANADET